MMPVKERTLQIDMPRYVDTSDDHAADAYRKEIIDHIARFDSVKLLQVLVAIDDIEFEPNEETIAAMEEARAIARDPNAKRYTSYTELEADLITKIAAGEE